jgi:predicted nuclease with TOPRIM domain
MSTDAEKLAEALAEVEQLRARLEAVQADLDGAVDTMEWQRREIGRLRAEAAMREGR